MNWKTWAPLAIAIVLGLFAAKITLNLLNNKSHDDGDSGDTVAVVVAMKDLDAGALLTASDLKVTKVPRLNAPAAAFDNPATLEGRVLTTSLTENVPVVPTMLAEVGSASGIPSLLPPGMRAMTIDLGEVKGAAEFIQPKSKIDLVTTVTEDGQSKPVARTLLEDITVMAVGQRMNPNSPATGDAARTITLLLTPEQAEMLELATTTTKVRVMIRGSHDGSKVKTEGTTVAELRGGPSTQPTEEIVVARRNLEAGDLLTEADLMIQKVMPDEKPTVDYFAKTGPLLGRVMASRVTANQTLFPIDLAPVGTPAGLAGMLPTGMRAMTIDIDELKGATDFIQPKSKIDLITTVTEEGSTKPTAHTLLEDITVLATGSKIVVTEKLGAQTAKTLTLLLTPEQAETLELATTTTKVRLMLRNNLDGSKRGNDAVAAGNATATEISATVRPRSTSHTVRVFRAGVASKIVFDVETPAAKPKQDQTPVVTNGDATDAH